MTPPSPDSPAPSLSAGDMDADASAGQERIRVLLVEDEEVDCLAFQRTVQLEKLPYHLRIAKSVAAAQRMLAKEEFDVVLIDQMLPDGTGFDLFDAVDEASVILFVTRADDVTLAIRALQRGAADYLLKDPKRNYLKLLPAAVARALAHRTMLREARHAAQLLHEAFDGAPIGKALLSATGRFLRVNRALGEIVGRAPPELLAIGLAGVMSAEDLAPALAGLQRLTAGAEPKMRMEMRWRHRTGEMRWVQVDASLVHPERAGEVIVVWQVQDITERRQGGEALRESEARYRHLLESVTGYTYSTTIEGGRPAVTTHSPGSLNVTGYTAADYAAQPFLWFEMVEPADRAAVELHAAAALRGEIVQPLEHRIRRRDGGLRWVRNTLSPRRDVSGGLVGCDGLVEDITGRKLAEEALVSAKTFLQQVLDTSPGMIFVLDREGRIRFANRSTAEYYGATPEALVTHATVEVHRTAEEASAYVSDDLEVIRTGRKLAKDERNTAPDGTEHWFHTVKVPLARPDGTVDVLGIATDITARKHAEEDLRLSEERYRMLTAAAFEGVGVSENGVVVDANERLVALLGYTREEMIGRPVIDFIAPDSRALVAERVRAGDEQAYEHLLLRKDGTTPVVESRARMIQVGERRVRLTAVRDLTERKRAEEQRLEFERRLLDAQRLEALGTLAGGVAHDFNNILAAIFGNVALARMDVPENHPAQTVLAEIAQLSERARDLVRQILTFSQPQSDQRSVVRLEPLVHEAAKMLRAMIPATVQLDVELAGHSPTVLADATQIHQVFVNLCTNAWQAIGSRPGRVTLRVVGLVVSAAEAANDPRLREGTFAVLSVLDTGCGMDAETLKHVFDPFYTTKGPRQGTGLGLAVVHGIVKAHGGFVTVRSEPGHGALFQVYLPAAHAAPPSPAPVAGLVEAGPGSTTPATAKQARRILLVDDEPPVAKICTRLLQREGFAVQAFTAPDAALAVFESDPAAFDLVITDMSMPEMNGIDFTLAVHEVRPAIPVILTTGFTASLTEESAQSMGISALINKPVGPDELLAIVRRVLAAHGMSS